MKSSFGRDLKVGGKERKNVKTGTMAEVNI
jgi:hypothetical protein